MLVPLRFTVEGVVAAGVDAAGVELLTVPAEPVRPVLEVGLFTSTGLLVLLALPLAGTAFRSVSFALTACTGRSALLTALSDAPPTAL